MITGFKCKCGNTDLSKTKFYDGYLGYEAIVCMVCQGYSDNDSYNPVDDWSSNFLKGLKVNNAEVEG